MKKTGRFKVKYFGKWMEADRVSFEGFKEQMYLLDGDTVPISADVLDEEPIEIEDHRPKDPPGTKK